MQCIDQAYWGIFPHFEVTRFLSDSVRDSSETCFWFWDYHIPHYLGYSFEIRFRVSPSRHWSILHSDFLADYCWVEDSWLMMLDSSFGCALDIHTRAYLLISLRFLVVLGYVAILFMVTEMLDGFWQILYCASDIHTGAYSPLLDEIVFGQWYEDGWSLFVVCLTTLTSDLILGHISPIFFEYPWDWDSG